MSCCNAYGYAVEVINACSTGAPSPNFQSACDASRDGNVDIIPICSGLNKSPVASTGTYDEKPGFL